jgi:GTP-binding protein
MVIKTVNLETVCGITSRLPENTKPEFAFAGKSNVGKSTLINALMNRKSYARTSATPGKTQTINYYNINDEFYLVDLPGYGYATAGLKVREQWGKMIEKYLHSSKMLETVFLLVDARHEPSANDVMMFDWIVSAGFTPCVIATKADKLKRSQVAKQMALIRRTIKEKSEAGRDVSFRVIPFSGLNKAGREDIYDILESFLKRSGGSENEEI